MENLHVLEQRISRDREVVLKQVIFYAIYVFVQRTLIHLWLQKISGRARGGISRRVAALFAAAGVGAAACTALRNGLGARCTVCVARRHPLLLAADVMLVHEAS